MTEYKVGQRVKVEFEGTIQELESKDSCLRVVTDRGYNHYVYVAERNGDQTDTGAKVTLADPKDWPPRVGDIWEAEGEEWFAREGNIIEIYLVSTRPNRSNDVDDFKALNPVLVRRRGQ